MKQALIIAGGRMEPEFFRAYMDAYTFDFMAAVDFGLQFFYDAGLRPDLIVGDFDSVEKDRLRFFEGQKDIAWMRLNPEKDDTDTEAALRETLKRGYEKIHILGGTGGRVDHMLGNVGLLGIGLKTNTEILLVDAKNRIRMIQNDFSIAKKEQYGTYISLLPVTPEVTGITLSGMKYPLKDFTMKQFGTIGVSNEIVEDLAEIRLRDGILLVAESRD